MGIFKLLLLLFAFGIGSAMARPISYPGGGTLMYKHNAASETLFYHYSPSFKYSLGIEGVQDKRREKNYCYLRGTYLVDRKNTVSSQRNLYTQVGLSSNGAEEYFYGAHGDWETRKYFMGFALKKTQTNDQINDFYRAITLGVAPYLGDYGDIHTWLMVKHMRDSYGSEWETFPVIRLFKGNFFFEAGYSDYTRLDLHVMYRF